MAKRVTSSSTTIKNLAYVFDSAGVFVTVLGGGIMIIGGILQKGIGFSILGIVIALFPPSGSCRAGAALAAPGKPRPRAGRGGRCQAQGFSVG